MAKKRLQCFVASAFGYNDVDNIYEKCVFSTLKKLNLSALRVDRIEHNEDIDDKIFALLDKADLCIADLTYARPSVYYEAGYAFGKGKPVIYIARSDHFRAKESDPDDLLKVHFDLQMKNIIPWTKPNDAFSRRLEKRLKHVIGPLNKNLHDQEILREEQIQFSRMSQHEQIQNLTKKAFEVLLSKGFTLYGGDKKLGLQSGEFCVYRNVGEKLEEIKFECMSSLTKKVLDNFVYWTPLSSHALVFTGPIKGHVFYVSLHSVPRSRIMNTLSYYRTLESGSMYGWFKSKNEGNIKEIYVDVIDSVKSSSYFQDRFEKLLLFHGIKKID